MKLTKTFQDFSHLSQSLLPDEEIKSVLKSVAPNLDLVTLAIQYHELQGCVELFSKKMYCEKNSLVFGMTETIHLLLKAAVWEITYKYEMNLSLTYFPGSWHGTQ